MRRATRACLILLLTILSAHASPVLPSSNEIEAFAVVGGYKVPFKIRTIGEISDNVQGIAISTSFRKMPPIQDKSADYELRVINMKQCGVSNNTLCLRILSNIHLDVLVPNSGHMSFYCIFRITNKSGKISTEDIDVRNLQFDLGFQSFLISFSYTKEQIKQMIKNRLRTIMENQSIDLGAIGIQSDLETTVNGNEVEALLKIKYAIPGMDAIKISLSQEDSKHVQIEAGVKPAFFSEIGKYVQSDQKWIPLTHDADGFVRLSPGTHLKIKLPSLSGKVKTIDTEIALNEELQKYISIGIIKLYSAEDGNFCLDKLASVRFQRAGKNSSFDEFFSCIF